MADNEFMGFWDMVKLEIRQANTTQEWVASQIPVRADVFSRWVQRNTIPRADQVYAIAKALNTSVEHLIENTPYQTEEAVPDYTGTSRQKLINLIQSLDEQQTDRALRILIEVFSGEKKEGDSKKSLA